MISTRGLWFAVIVLVLILLNFSLRPLLSWRAPIDFLTIATLLVAVRSRPGAAAAAGFCLGLLGDALVPDAFGAGALAMTLVGFAASWLKAAFFADNLALNAAFVFLGKMTFDAVYLVAERRLLGADLLRQLGIWSPLSALATAAVGLVVLLTARTVLGAPRS